MRKRKRGRKFSRERDPRRALLRGLAASLLANGRIRTTEARAKELRSLAERLLTWERQGKIADRRRVAALIGKATEQKVFRGLASQGRGLQGGGYTRIRKLGGRRSDSARMALIELIGR